MSDLPFNGTAVWDSLSHLVRRERNWLYRQRHPSHSQRITTSGLVEYRGTCRPSGVAHMPRYGAAPRTCTRSITTFWDMIPIISLRAHNEKDLKGKERVVPPGIEIPGIPARKLVKLIASPVLASCLGWRPRAGFSRPCILECMRGMVPFGRGRRLHVRV